MKYILMTKIRVAPSKVKSQENYKSIDLTQCFTEALLDEFVKKFS